jgi:hypothetical protein
MANRAPVPNRSAPDEPGQPTPEGVHRDGVDYVLVLMVRRTNIAQGTTTIHCSIEPCSAASRSPHRSTQRSSTMHAYTTA